MNKLTLAIIDSGIDKNIKINGMGIKLNENTKKYFVTHDIVDRNGHGTIVTNIIREIIDDENLYIVKLFDQQDEVEVERLVFALQYLRDFIKPDVIHLSMGISFCDNITKLREVCQNIVENGTVIVCAFDNNGSLSYPAAFPFVIGVESNSSLIKTTEYYFLQDSPINIAAIGSAQRLLGKNNHYVDVVGSSFSAPYITRLIAENIILGNTSCNFDDVLKFLKGNSKKVYCPERQEPIELPFNIEKAIFFPYNKEISTLLRNADSLICEPIGIFDVKYLGNIGKDIFISEGTHLIIDTFESIPWEADFDTVILGHLNELSNISKKDYMKSFVEKCIIYKKNIYTFDYVSEDIKTQMEAANLKLYTPIITKNNAPFSYESKLRQIGKPILCIAGTSPKQGKFSLQLQLKKTLSKVIRVGLLSTEPSGYLAGANVVFPMGYDSTVQLEVGNDYISTVNYAMGMLEDENVDLIITGLQSQTIPMKLCNQRDMVLFNHYYMLGANPDAVILMINVFDDFDYIQRTIQYIENIIICDVIALVIFPIKRTFKWNTLGDLSVRYDDYSIEEVKERLKTVFNKVVYTLDDEKDMNDLSNQCLTYFADKE